MQRFVLKPMYITLYKERKGGFGRGPYWILVIIFGLESTTEPMFEEEVQCRRRQWTEVGEGITCAYQRNRKTRHYYGMTEDMTHQTGPAALSGCQTNTPACCMSVWVFV